MIDLDIWSLDEIKKVVTQFKHLKENPPQISSSASKAKHNPINAEEDDDRQRE